MQASVVPRLILSSSSNCNWFRERYGVEVFRRFFEAIVEQCQQAGLIWGKELYFDGTKVAANAGMESLTPRFFSDAHQSDLLGTGNEEAAESMEPSSSQEGQSARDSEEQQKRQAPVELPTALSHEEHAALCQHNAQRHAWIEEVGAQDRRVTSHNYQRLADYQVSTTDPDATVMQTKGGVDLGYHTHMVVDGGKARIILQVLVTP